MSTAQAIEGGGAAPKGHPKGLYLLFSTEMWERMSYYGMRALLTLYMTAATERGGFGWTRPHALKVYGIYTGLVYFTPLAGGYLADKYLGQRRAVVIGGVLMMLGQFMMAVPGHTAFFSALALLILGNGMFKPNISTMVGGLYDKKDPRRDGAYTIFYMGINLGAFLAPYICGTLGEKVGWKYGFAAAGFGMMLGLVNFLVLHNKLLGTIGLAPKALATMAETKTTDKEGYREPASKDVAVPTALTHDEKDRLGVIFMLTFFNIFFWAAFEQAGGLMNLYTDEKVNRHLFGYEVPTTWFQSINPFFIFAMGPIFSWGWSRLGRMGRDPSTPAKLAMGLLFLSSGFVAMLFASKQSEAVGKASMFWVIGAYFLHTVGELCLSPVGLSAVNRLSPARLASVMMGVWLCSSAIANYTAGAVGSYSEQLGEFKLFMAIMVVTAAAGAGLLTLAPWISKKQHLETL